MSSPPQQLSAKWAWWRMAWPYRFAHKPLCSRFHSDVLHVGRLNLCRSCACFHLGWVTTLAVLGLTSPAAGASLIALGLSLTAVVALSHPARHAGLERRTKDVLRALAGACPALAIGLVWSGHPRLGSALLVGLIALAFGWRRARASHRAQMCDGCPELLEQRICSGFRAQAEAVQAHERRVEDALLKSGFRPDVPSRRPHSGAPTLGLPARPRP